MKFSFNHLWKTQRRFILQVAGAAGIFLVLASVATSYASVRRDTETNDSKAAELDGKMADLDLNYHPKIGERQDLERRLAELMGKVGITGRSGVKIPNEDYHVDFATKKNEVYTDFKDRANAISLRCPESKDVLFDEGSNLTDQEWIDRYRQLEVLRRVLNACLTHGPNSIVAIRPGLVETKEISGPNEPMLIRYPVQLEMIASFETVLGLFETFQNDGDFLSVEVQQLVKNPEPGSPLLKATINFVGIDLCEARVIKHGPGTQRSSGFRRTR